MYSGVHEMYGLSMRSCHLRHKFSEATCSYINKRLNSRHLPSVHYAVVSSYLAELNAQSRYRKVH